MADPRPVCVVTGASAGIDAATVVEVARRGYDVALTGRDVLGSEPAGAVGGDANFVDGKQKALAPRATDPELARRLWDDSARMVGLEP